jgi:hypothetical protein
MEPDRFDDVGYEILESPDPVRPPRARRTLAVTGLALAGCALAAAAALAVTTPGSPPPPHERPAAAPPHTQFNADGVPVYHHGPTCALAIHQRARKDTYPARGHRRHAFTPRY